MYFIIVFVLPGKLDGFCCNCGPDEQIPNDEGEFNYICPPCSTQHCMYYAATNPNAFTTKFDICILL